MFHPGPQKLENLRVSSGLCSNLPKACSVGKYKKIGRINNVISHNGRVVSCNKLYNQIEILFEQVAKRKEKYPQQPNNGKIY